MIIFVLVMVSCENAIDEEIIIYSNDFEGMDENGISGARFSEFNNSVVLGNFNNGEFSLQLHNLPQHDFIWVQFDLIIHDSWDGNTKTENGPDRWLMEINESVSKKSPFDFIRETSFSNSICNSSLCYRQSFPQVFPSNNQPKSGISTSANGFCLFSANDQGSSVFDISEVIPHTKNQLLLRCYDLLRSSRSIQDPLCDESWSIDNIIIRAISI